MREHIAAFCERHGLLAHGATVVVAVSGGPDSVCLLHILRTLAPRWRLQLHIAHLDHLLRPESSDDAHFVQELAMEWQLPITVTQEDIAARSHATHAGIEATARTVRLRFLADVAQRIGATAIALGHNADDQAETVLLRLMRGAGPSGLAAMQPRRSVGPGLAERPIMLIRPLLETRRSEIEAYCSEHQLRPRHDATNELPIYTRNRVRGYILPLLNTYNPRIVAALGRTARICAEEDDLINRLTNDIWQELATVEANRVTLDRERFTPLHTALKRRLVRQAAIMLDPDVEIEAKHIDLLLAAVEQNRRRWQLPRGLWLGMTRTQLRFMREPTQVNNSNDSL